MNKPMSLPSVSLSGSHIVRPRIALTRPPRRKEVRGVRVAMAMSSAPGTWSVSSPPPQVVDVLASADAWCFDVDSTFCQDESIDELAAFLGVGEQVAAVTARAMGGSMKFQDALAQRLDVMRPSATDVESYLASHPPLITPGIPELLSLLKSKSKKIFLVSGGFRQIIHPLAEGLNIPTSHVFANSILFDPADGSYAGFDPKEFTSRSGGKAEAVAHIKREWDLRTVVMVGDGATDAEARRPGGADVFVGYGGVVYREAVAERADWYVLSIEDIVKVVRQGKDPSESIPSIER